MGILAVLGLAAWIATRPREVEHVVGKASETDSGEPGSEGSASAAGATSEEASRLAADGRGRAAPIDPRPVLVGRVVDGDGRPVAGAVIGSRALRGVGVLVEPALTVAPQAGAATTDATGAFRFVPEPASPTPEPGAARHRVFAWAGARGVAVVEDVALDLPVEIVLAPGGTLYGTVRDADGHPVAGARMTGTAAAASGAFRCEITSGPGGAYVVEGIPPPDALMHATIHWDVDGGRHRTFGGPSPYPAPGESVPFDVIVFPSTTPLAPLDGIVVDGDTGAPIPGARLSRLPVRTSPSTTSGEDGRFHFDEAPVPTVNKGVTLLGEAAGYAPAQVTLGEGKAYDAAAGARLVLWRPAAVEGVVVDETGAPLAGVRLGCPSAWAASLLRGEGRQPIASAADGTFRLDDIPAPSAEEVEVRISVKGRTDGLMGKAVRVRGGETTRGVRVEWRREDLLPIAFVEGVVTDGTGRGIPGASVGFGDGFPDVVTTGADGSFRLPRYKMPYATPRFVYASAPGFVRGWTPYATRAPTEPHHIALSPARVLVGTVSDEDGRPLPGVAVQAVGVRPVTAADPSAGNLADFYNDGESTYPSQGPAALESAVTDGAGRFRWSRVPVGPFPVEIVWLGEGGSRHLERREVPAGDGPVRFVVPGQPRPRAIEVRVVDDATGRPLAEVPWARWLASGSEAGVVGHERGELAGPGLLRVPVPRRAPLRCEVGATGWCSAIVAVSADDPSPHPRLEVRLRRGATVRGRIRAPEGVVLGSIVMTHLETGQRVEAPIDGDGRFELSGIPSGAVSLDLSAGRSHATVPPTQVLAAGDTATDVEATAVPGTTLYPRVSCERLVSPPGPDGRRAKSDPRADEAWVGVLDASGQPIRRHVGRGLLYGTSVTWTLPPGEYALEGQAPGGDRATLPFTVPTGSGDSRPPLRLELRLP